MFVFGSSLVDNGNNNNLIDAIAKADYLPYGIDFPGGASGRFTNGKNVIDLLGQHLQIPGYIPPFTHPSTRGPNIVHGVNYASGGSGILDDTGAVLVRGVAGISRHPPAIPKWSMYKEEDGVAETSSRMVSATVRKSLRNFRTVAVSETRTGFQFEFELLGKPEPLALAHKFSAVGIVPDLRFEEKKSKNSELLVEKHIRSGFLDGEEDEDMDF
nr:GDSL esterase/lipase At1g29670-like [Ipomoea batatas]